jgi:signal transduction histidine kinase
MEKSSGSRDGNVMSGRYKMPYLVGALLLIVLALGWMGVSFVNKVADLTEELYEHPFTVSRAVLRIHADVIIMHRAMKDIILADTPEAAKPFQRIVDQTEDKVYADFRLVEERFLGDPGLVSAAHQSFTAWKPIRDEVIRLTQEGKRREAVFISQNEGARQVEDVEGKINAVRDFSRNKAQEFMAAAKQTRARTLWFEWFCIAFALIIAVFLAYKAVRVESGLQELNNKLDVKVQERTAQLAAANENLTVQYEEITAMNEELTAQNEEIAALNAELEQRVNERTADLTAANEELTAQYDQLAGLQSDLRSSEENFRTFFDSVSEGVALHEMLYEGGEAVDYRITRTNPAYESHTGLSPEMVKGRLATQIYGTAYPPYIKEFDEVAQTGTPYVFETYFQPLDKHFRISVVSPKQGHFATIFEDITERVKRENELRLKNEEISRFVYTVSHDLRSPLVTIKAFLGYLEQDIKDGDKAAADKDMDFIRNAADKMAVLLDELLKLSRIGSKVNPSVEIPLQELAQDVLNLVAGRISERGVRVKITDDPVVLYGDVARLSELYQNLIDNAVKFMGDQSEPTIEVGVRTDARGITLFVKDNGSGIDRRHQKKLFGLFEKLDKTSEGAGMGLAIAKRVVELHGGSIWVESDGLGAGTTFCFTLARTRIETAEGGKP